MKVDGGCHCGAITYEAEVDPQKVGICHCTDCQQFSGSAFRITVQVAEGDLKMTGTPKVYVKTADSGRRRAQGFCAECGTHLFAASADSDRPNAYSLRVGNMRQRHELEPKRQIWCSSELGWLGRIAELPRVEGQP